MLKYDEHPDGIQDPVPRSRRGVHHIFQIFKKNAKLGTQALIS